MATRKKVYCEYGFWEKFIEAYPHNVGPIEYSIKKMKRWMNIYSFLYKSDILIDITITELREIIQTDENMRMLWKKSTEGQCGFECIGGKKYLMSAGNAVDFVECIGDNEYLINAGDAVDFVVSSDDLNAVYLTCNDKEKSEAIAKRFGVLIIPIDTIDSFDNLYEIFIHTINRTNKQNENVNWNIINSTNHKCNTLAIVDGYLLQNDTCIEKNLLPILNNYLPISLDIPFNISIFTNCEVKNKEGQESLNLEKRHSFIREKIVEIRPNLNFTLGLFSMKGQLHDRTLLTNYLYLESGAGFDLICYDKGNTFLRFNKRTKITAFYPFTVPNTKEAVNEYYNLCRSLNRISKDEKLEYYGDKQNRLFDFLNNRY
jgi:hypothetical protein